MSWVALKQYFSFKKFLGFFVTFVRITLRELCVELQMKIQKRLAYSTLNYFANTKFAKGNAHQERKEFSFS
jgi:hypothetical protein